SFSAKNLESLPTWRNLRNLVTREPIDAFCTKFDPIHVQTRGNID
ncbi:hypothetical protein HMPREF1575_00821, partial [Gardnerella vaginalis JCP7672]